MSTVFYPDSVPVPLENLLGENPSVRSFGALGDGATDDSLAFQKAMKNSQYVLVPSKYAYRIGASAFASLPADPIRLEIRGPITLLGDVDIPANVDLDIQAAIDLNGFQLTIRGGIDSDINQKFTNATGVKATGLLTGTENPADGDTVQLAGLTYRFKDTMAAAFDVQRGVDLAASLSNLKKAINLSGVAGTDYFAGTTINIDVQGTTLTATTLAVEATYVTPNGNEFTTTTPVGTALTWGGATLSGGDYAARFLTNRIHEIRVEWFGASVYESAAISTVDAGVATATTAALRRAFACAMYSSCKAIRFGFSTTPAVANEYSRYLIDDEIASGPVKILGQKGTFVSGWPGTTIQQITSGKSVFRSYDIQEHAYGWFNHGLFIEDFNLYGPGDGTAIRCGNAGQPSAFKRLYGFNWDYTLSLDSWIAHATAYLHDVALFPGPIIGGIATLRCTNCVGEVRTEHLSNDSSLYLMEIENDPTTDQNPGYDFNLILDGLKSEGRPADDFPHSHDKLIQVVNGNGGRITIIGGFAGADPRTIEEVRNNGSGVVRITLTAHQLTTGDEVFANSNTGHSEVNGVWTITVVDADHFDLDGSTYVSDWEGLAFNDVIGPTKAIVHISGTGTKPRVAVVGLQSTGFYYRVLDESTSPATKVLGQYPQIQPNAVPKYPPGIWTYNDAVDLRDDLLITKLKQSLTIALTDDDPDNNPWIAGTSEVFREFRGLVAADSNDFFALFAGYRAKGNLASPTAVAASLPMLGIDAWGYQNGAYRLATRIRCLVYGTPSGSIVPGEIEFGTRNAAGALTARLLLNADEARFAPAIKSLALTASKPVFSDANQFLVSQDIDLEASYFSNQLPVAKGGTAATSAAGARTNLSAAQAGAATDTITDHQHGFT